VVWYIIVRAITIDAVLDWSEKPPRTTTVVSFGVFATGRPVASSWRDGCVFVLTTSRPLESTLTAPVKTMTPPPSKDTWPFLTSNEGQLISQSAPLKLAGGLEQLWFPFGKVL